MASGAAVLGVGALLVIVGAAVATAPTHCAGEDFCGFGQALEAVTIMGVGGGTGLIGIVLTAIGGASASPEVPPDRATLLYLPR